MPIPNPHAKIADFATSAKPSHAGEGLLDVHQPAGWMGEGEPREIFRLILTTSESLVPRRVAFGRNRRGEDPLNLVNADAI
jgi:hypothetical protein